jgi:hypothetical protein
MCSQWRAEVKKVGENGEIFQPYLLFLLAGNAGKAGNASFL